MIDVQFNAILAGAMATISTAKAIPLQDGEPINFSLGAAGADTLSPSGDLTGGAAIVPADGSLKVFSTPEAALETCCAFFLRWFLAGSVPPIWGFLVGPYSESVLQAAVSRTIDLAWANLFAAGVVQAISDGPFRFHVSNRVTQR